MRECDMKPFFPALCSLIVLSISLACRPTGCLGENAQDNIHGTASEEATLKAYLQKMDDSADTSYVAAVLRFNAKTYPHNPSVLPGKQGASGETVIGAPLQSEALRGTL